MSPAREVVFVSAVRTGIGKFGGALKDSPPTDLAALVVREAVGRAGLEPREIGQVVFGNVIHTDAHDMYLARVATVKAGLPVETPAFNVNRLCGSGMQAIVSAAQGIMLGEFDAAVAGGAECMSRSQYWIPGMRWGQRMNDGTVVDAMVAALSDPFDDCHMGITAENVAAKWEISRQAQDELAVESHRRAAAATNAGFFKEQIVPVEVKVKGGTTQFVADEQIRADASMEGLAKLKAAFKTDGSVTAGNASGINDAAAAVVLMDRETAEKRGIRPLGRLVSHGYAGVEPRYMGIGPVPAVRSALERANLSVADLDTIELNEAFAAQALAVVRDLDLPLEKTNPNGSGISLGHPVGATGAILTVKALYELQRTGGRYGLITMCIGGGQGIAAIVERI